MMILFLWKCMPNQNLLIKTIYENAIEQFFLVSDRFWLLNKQFRQDSSWKELTRLRSLLDSRMYCPVSLQQLMIQSQ